MARARRRHEWDQTAQLWSSIVNAARSFAGVSDPVGPWDIHPLRGPEDYAGALDQIAEAAEPDHAQIAEIKRTCKVTIIKPKRGARNG